MTFKRFETGDPIIMVFIFILLFTFTATSNSDDMALGVMPGCGTKLKVSIIGLHNQKDNASAIVTGRVIGSSYRFANSTISIPGIGIGQVILGLKGNQSGLYSILIKGLPSEMLHTSFFGTSIPKEEVCPASSISKLPHSPPGYIYIPGIGFGEWELTKES